MCADMSGHEWDMMCVAQGMSSWLMSNSPMISLAKHVCPTTSANDIYLASDALQ